jgi:hypothetical protein
VAAFAFGMLVPMAKIIFEQVAGELLRDGKTVHNVTLILTVNEISVDQRSTPVRRIIDTYKLSPASARAVRNGEYTVRFSFDGKQEQREVEVHGETLLHRSGK